MNIFTNLFLYNFNINFLSAYPVDTHWLETIYYMNDNINK